MTRDLGASETDRVSSHHDPAVDVECRVGRPGCDAPASPVCLHPRLRRGRAPGQAGRSGRRGWLAAPALLEAPCGSRVGRARDAVRWPLELLRAHDHCGRCRPQLEGLQRHWGLLAALRGFHMSLSHAGRSARHLMIGRRSAGNGKSTMWRFSSITPRADQSGQHGATADVPAGCYTLFRERYLVIPKRGGRIATHTRPPRARCILAP